MSFYEDSFKKLKPNFLQDYIFYINSLSQQYDFKELNSLSYLDNSLSGDESHLYNGSIYMTQEIKKLFVNEINK